MDVVGDAFGAERLGGAAEVLQQHAGEEAAVLAAAEAALLPFEKVPLQPAPGLGAQPGGCRYGPHKAADGFLHTSHCIICSASDTLRRSLSECACMRLQA